MLEAAFEQMARAMHTWLVLPAPLVFRLQQELCSLIILAASRMVLYPS